jgi:MFS family permease
MVVTSMWLTTPNLALFLAGGAITGLGSGAMFKGSVGTVMMIAEPEHRAESMAGVLLAGYLGLSVPAIALGITLRSVSPKVTLLGFTIVVAVAIIAAAPVLLRGERRQATPPAPQASSREVTPAPTAQSAAGADAPAASSPTEKSFNQNTHDGRVTATK